MSNQNVADYLLDRLRTWGIQHVFAFPGDGINGLLAAWGRADNDPQFIQARHEEMAAFEAVGYAKFTGRVGVCVATSGPGAIHLLNGLYDAKLDHVPVVAIVGQTTQRDGWGLPAGGRPAQPCSRTSPRSTSRWSPSPNSCRTCSTGPSGPRSRRPRPRSSCPPTSRSSSTRRRPMRSRWCPPVGLAWPVTSPDDAAIQQAADILNAGSKVAILVGQGARGARKELTEVADRLGAGVAKPLLGKDVLSDELPYVTGSIGLLGTRPSYEMMRDCDTLLIVGSNFPYTQFLPDFGQARAVQIDIDASRIGMRYPNELNLVGDAQTALAALLPTCAARTDRCGETASNAKSRAGGTRWPPKAMSAADPINPMHLFAALSPLLPDDAIVTADSGSSANWYARQLRFRGDMRGSLSGTLATMGPGVPYGIGAKFAHPQRPVIVFAGDGAMQMNGMAELITIKRYWQRWADPRLVVAVLHNNDLNQVTWEMRAMSGAPKFVESQSLPDVDYAAFATSLGLVGRLSPTRPRLGPAWQEALAADRPTVLDVHTDPDVPPIPPHATFEQMKDAASALLHGDVNRWGVIKEGLKIKAQELRPGARQSDTQPRDPCRVTR